MRKTVNMILRKEDFRNLKSDVDLDKTTNIISYYKKICLIAESTHKHQLKMKDDALKIKGIIESEYPEYLL